MAYPPIRTRDTQRKHEYVMIVDGLVMGQVRSFNINETINTATENRISDTTLFKTREDKDSRITIELYMQDNMREFAAVMGGETLPATGGWLGTEVIKLDPDSSGITVQIEVYDSIADGNLQGTYTLLNFNATSNSIPVGNVEGSVVATIEAACDDISYAPEAGVGG